MYFVFVCWHTNTNKYQKYKPFELGDQLVLEVLPHLKSEESPSSPSEDQQEFSILLVTSHFRHLIAWLGWVYWATTWLLQWFLKWVQMQMLWRWGMLWSEHKSIDDIVNEFKCFNLSRPHCVMMSHILKYLIYCYTADIFSPDILAPEHPYAPSPSAPW